MNRFKKFIAWVICFAMVISMVPAIAVKAEGEGIKLRFSKDVLGDVDLSYTIGSGEAIQVASGSASGDYIWVDVASGDSVMIKAEPKEGQRVKDFSVYEGETGTARAYNSQFERKEGYCTYSFPVRDNISVYVVDVQMESGGEPGPGHDPGHEGRRGLEAVAYCENVSGEGESLFPVDEGAEFLFMLEPVSGDASGEAREVYRSPGINSDKVDENGITTGNIEASDYYKGADGNDDKGCAYWRMDNGRKVLVLFNLKANYLFIKGSDGMNIEVRGNVEIGTVYMDRASLEIQNFNGERENGASFMTLNVDKFEGAANSNQRLSFRDDVIVNVGSSDDKSAVAFENIGEVYLWNYNFHNRYTVNNTIYADCAFKNVKEVPVVSSKTQINCDTLASGDASGNATTIYTYQEGDLTINQSETFDYGSCQILNKYYSHYPTEDKEHPGLATSKDFINDQPANGLVATYVAKTGDLKNLEQSKREEGKVSGDASGNASGDGHYQGMYEVTVSGNASGDAAKSFRLKSLDPILYSISYQADPNKENEIYKTIIEPSGNTGIEVKDISVAAGKFTMEGFDRGYYIEEDGRFEAWIAAGEEVKVKIIPDEGYQYLAGSVNVNSNYFATKAGEDVGVYTYTMGPHAGHLSAGFIKTENLVVNEASEAGVTGGTIADAGINAEMTIEEGAASEAEKAEFGKQAEGVTFDSFVDIVVEERIVKNFDVKKANNEQEAWKTPKAELTKPANVTINLDSAKYTAKDYQVVRQHKNKDNTVSYEKIPAVYDAAKHTLTFESDKFSTYAIGAKDETQAEPAPVHSHSYKTEWSSDETNHWYAASCEHKTEVKDKAAHTFKEVIDKQATETEEGSKHEECSVCGYKKVPVAIPKLEKQDTTPKPENNKSEVKAEDNNKVTTTDKGEATITELKETKSKSVTVPSSTKVGDYTYTVTTIGKEAFKNAKKATTVTLPNTITKINANAFAKSKITTVKVTVKKGAKLTVNKNAFKKSKVKKVQVTISKKATAKEKNAITKAFTKAGIKKGNIKFKKK